MNKIFLSLTLCFITSLAFSEVKPLFYETFNFAEDDTLNVREKPNYKSEKVGEIDLNMRVSVQECTQVKKSKWCKIKSLDVNDIVGWVNAKYILPLNTQEGYVVIKNRKSICDYVVQCQIKNKKTQCLVVTGLENQQKVVLQTEWIDHALLEPATNFSAAANADLNPEGGFCTRGNYVKESLKRTKLKTLSKQFTSSEFPTVLALLKALNEGNKTAIESLIHPKKGIILSALSYFDDKGSQQFSQKSFIKSYNSKKRLNWGNTEAKGDLISESLSQYIEDLSGEIRHIGKVIKLENINKYSFKNFPRSKGQKIKSYEIYWYGDDNLKEYAYSGLVIILEAYKNKWYIVGITQDYWTP